MHTEGAPTEFRGQERAGQDVKCRGQKTKADAGPNREAPAEIAVGDAEGPPATLPASTPALLAHTVLPLLSPCVAVLVTVASVPGRVPGDAERVHRVTPMP